MKKGEQTQSILGPWKTVSTSKGNYNVVSVSSDVYYSDTQKIKEFLEFILLFLGVDLTYEQFINMDDSEKKKFLRDLKINKIIKEC